MNILITGNGFIGSNLSKYLTGNFNNIVACASRSGISKASLWFYKYAHFKLDLLNSNDVENFMDWFLPDVIFHLAANPSVEEDNFIDNITITKNVLDNMPEKCKLIYTSSATVYGNKELSSENGAKETDPINPESVYGASKATCELLVQSYCNSGLRKSAVILRLIANTGPGATHGIVRALVHKSKQEGNYMEVFGKLPGCIKSYLHVSDTVAALKHFGIDYEHDKPYDIINISNQDTISAEQIARLVMVMSPTCKAKWAKFDPSKTWAGDNPLVRVNNDYSKSLGWSPKLNSRQAVKQGIIDMLATV